MQSGNPFNLEEKEVFKNQAIIDYYTALPHVPTQSFSEIKLCLENISAPEHGILIALVTCAIVCRDANAIRFFKGPMQQHQAAIARRLEYLYTNQDPLLSAYLVRFVCRQQVLGHEQIQDNKKALALFGLQIIEHRSYHESGGPSYAGPEMGFDRTNKKKDITQSKFAKALSAGDAATFGKMMEELKFTKDTPEAADLMCFALQQGLDFAVSYFLSKRVKLKMDNDLLKPIMSRNSNKETIIDLYLTNVKEEAKDDFQANRNALLNVTVCALECNEKSVLKMVVEKHFKDPEIYMNVINLLVSQQNLATKVNSLIAFLQLVKQTKAINLLESKNEFYTPLSDILQMHKKAKKGYSSLLENNFDDAVTDAQVKLLEFFIKESNNVADVLQKPIAVKTPDVRKEGSLFIFAIKQQCHIRTINFLISLYDQNKIALEPCTLDTAFANGTRDAMQDSLCSQLIKRKLPLSNTHSALIATFHHVSKINYHRPNRFQQPTETKIAMVRDIFENYGSNLFAPVDSKVNEPNESAFPFSTNKGPKADSSNATAFMGYHLQQDVLQCFILQYQFYCHEVSNCAISFLGVKSLNHLVMSYVCDMPYFNEHTTQSAFSFFANASIPAFIASPTSDLIYFGDESGDWSIRIMPLKEGDKDNGNTRLAFN